MADPRPQHTGAAGMVVGAAIALALATAPTAMAQVATADDLPTDGITEVVEASPEPVDTATTAPTPVASASDGESGPPTTDPTERKAAATPTTSGDSAAASEDDDAPVDTDAPVEADAEDEPQEGGADGEADGDPDTPASPAAQVADEPVVSTDEGEADLLLRVAALGSLPLDDRPGVYSSDYEVLVTNLTDTAHPVDVEAELQFGAGIEVVEIEANQYFDVDVTINEGYDGVEDTALVDGTPVVPPGERLFLEVRALVRVDADLHVGGATDCDLTPSESGTALALVGTATSGASTADQFSCAQLDGEVTNPEIEAPTVAVLDVEVRRNVDGTLTVVKDIVVTNEDDQERRYTVNHWLRFGDGIEILGRPTVTSDDAATNPGYTGLDRALQVTDGTQAIAAGATDTYRLEVDVDPGSLDVTDRVPEALDCDLAPGEVATGLLSSSRLFLQDFQQELEPYASSCPPLPLVIVDGAGAPVATPTVDGVEAVAAAATLPRTGPDMPWLAMLSSLLVLIGTVLHRLGASTVRGR